MRPDQVRDKDSIRRDAIVARIKGPVSVHAVPDSIYDYTSKATSETWRLLIGEPAPADGSKFVFIFDTVKDLEEFSKKVVEAVWRVTRP